MFSYNTGLFSNVYVQLSYCKEEAMQKKRERWNLSQLEYIIKAEG